jgi:hypothetical protein
MTTKTRFVRYQHRKRPDIEYDVLEDSAKNGLPFTRYDPKTGELCHLVRTVRNASFFEEVHQPAYTLMPAARFLELYARVESREGEEIPGERT